MGDCGGEEPGGSQGKVDWARCTLRSYSELKPASPTIEMISSASFSQWLHRGIRDVFRLLCHEAGNDLLTGQGGAFHENVLASGRQARESGMRPRTESNAGAESGVSIFIVVLS
jgi:hypothetical protein